jgi:hypothetical protein
MRFGTCRPPQPLTLLEKKRGPRFDLTIERLSVSKRVGTRHRLQICEIIYFECDFVADENISYWDRGSKSWERLTAERTCHREAQPARD